MFSRARLYALARLTILTVSPQLYAGFPTLETNKIAPVHCAALMAKERMILFRLRTLRARENLWEISSLPRGARYFVEKRYFQHWGPGLADQEEEVPYLRLVNEDEVEREIRMDEQLYFLNLRHRHPLNPIRFKKILQSSLEVSKHRQIIYKLEDRDGLLQKRLRVFDGTDDATQWHVETGGRGKTPLELSTGLSLPRDIGGAILELGQGLDAGLFPSPDDETENAVMFKEVATYVDSIYLQKNWKRVSLYVHTTAELGRLSFSRFGFKLWRDLTADGFPNEVILHQDGAEFVAKFGSRFAHWNRYWENSPQLAFAIFDSPKRKVEPHPLCRPTIRDYPTWKADQIYAPPLIFYDRVDWQDTPERCLNQWLIGKPMTDEENPTYLRSKAFSF